MEFRTTPSGDNIEVYCNGQSFGTHGVARICKVTPATVEKWIRSGRLRSYRVPGPHRRIGRSTLIRFLRDHGMSQALANIPPE
jgi:excisionase family DNA binding protein